MKIDETHYGDDGRRIRMLILLRDRSRSVSSCDGNQIRVLALLESCLQYVAL